jgi:Putative DNA-binding domain
MEPELHSQTQPPALVEYIKSASDNCFFKRRAILSLANQEWHLACCTVEVLKLENSFPKEPTTHSYAGAILYEDYLDKESCLIFVKELDFDKFSIAKVEVKCGQHQQWSTQQVSIQNDCMNQAGLVVRRLCGNSLSAVYGQRLLHLNQPYYPSVEDALRDWMPFRTHHGRSDSRNNCVLFLLPQTQAYISSGSRTTDATLEVSVDGSDVGKLRLFLKGAYWLGDAIKHFQVKVSPQRATINIPSIADRVELFLIDEESRIYDLFKESKTWGYSSGVRFLKSNSASLTDKVYQALAVGENQQFEFKPFVDLDEKSDGTKKTKLLEVIKTVVAFVNTDGGWIFLGIDDDCVLIGIDEKLRIYAKESEANAIDSYCGALKSKIKARIDGEADIVISHDLVDNKILVLIEVRKSKSGPICVDQDHHFYVRRGASNRKLLPREWESTLKTGAYQMQLAPDR